MSYIITSNLPTENEFDRITGTHRPFSYTNHIANGITIPANSQVSLESIKFTKGGSGAIVNGNNVWYTYLGTELSDTVNIEDTVNFPMRTFIEPGDYVPTSKGLAFQQELRNSIFHPNYQLSNINVSGITTSVTQDAEGELTGFSASFVCNSSASNASDDSNGWIPATVFDLNNNSFVAGSNGEISNVSAEHSVTLIQKDSPLSLTGGEFKFQFNSGDGEGGAVVDTAVGLTRCTRTKIGNGPVNSQATEPSYFDNQGEDFFDYVIRCVPAPPEDIAEGVANHVLKLFHATVSPTDPNEISMQEFDYRVNASSNETESGYFTCDPTDDLDDQIINILWTISNEQVKITLEDKDNELHILCDGTNSNKLNSMKPVGPTTWHLFPKITIPACNPVVPVAPRFLQMLKWEGVQITDYQYGSELVVGKNVTELYQDWWAYSVNTGREVINCQKVDTRDAYNYDQAVPTPFAQKGLNASGAIDSKVVLIVRESELYNGSNTKLTVGANAALGLGFGTYSVIDSTFYTTPLNNLLINIKSTDDPVSVSRSSLFVRLGNLTQKSFNMAKSANSQIIYHIPRFDNAGNESGALYFAPPERIYIDLNNPDPIVINSLDIALVKGDETLAQSITGKTVCCLHIKEK